MGTYYDRSQRKLVFLFEHPEQQKCDLLLIVVGAGLRENIKIGFELLDIVKKMLSRKAYVQVWSSGEIFILEI